MIKMGKLTNLLAGTAVCGIALIVVLGMLGMPILGLLSGYINIGAKTVSAENWEKNYEWFKGQEAAMSQILNQVCVVQKDTARLEELNGNATAWSKTTRDTWSSLNFEKRGYVSKYNSLVAEYNARRASFIREFGRDARTPAEYAVFFDEECEGWEDKLINQW
jgi:hypothetical protein